MHRSLILGVIVLAAIAGPARPAGAGTVAADQDPPRLRAGAVVRLDGRLEDSDPALDDGSRIETYLFDCDAGVLEVTLASRAFDTYLAVRRFDEAGNPIWNESNDDDGEGSDSRIRRLIDARSLVQVVANAFDAEGRGDFVVEIRLTVPTPADLRAERLREAGEWNRRSVALLDAGVAAEALELSEQVLAVRRELLGEDDPETWTAIANYGVALRANGRVGEAEPFYRAALEARRLGMGADHPDTLTAMNNLGFVLQELARFAEAEQLYTAALATSRRTLGDDHPDTLILLNNLGYLLEDVGKAAEAEPFMREAMESRRRVMGDEHPSTLTSIGNYGVLLQSLGRLAVAEPFMREAVEISRRVHGNDHPNTLSSINNYGVLLESLGRLAEAETFAREAMESRRRLLGDAHPSTLVSISNYGLLIQALGRTADAEPYYTEALEASRLALGDEHPDTLTFINNYGFLLGELGRIAEAESFSREALDGRRRVFGDEHPETLVSINNQGMLLRMLGRGFEAEPLIREALETSRRVLGDDHPETLTAINNYGFLLGELGRIAEAEPYYREALASRRRTLGDEHPDTLNSLNNMSVLFESTGRPEEAEPFAREAIETRRRRFGEDHPDTLTSMSNYAHLLNTLGREAEAEQLARETLDRRRRVLGAEHPDTLISLNNYGLMLLFAGRAADAEPYSLEAMQTSRRVLGDGHPDTLLCVWNHGMLLESAGREAEARVLWNEYVAGAERLRDAAPGGERGRSARAEQMSLRGATVHAARLALEFGGGAAEAFDILERGRGRTLLDLIARSEESMLRVLRRQAPLAVVPYQQAIRNEAAAGDRIREIEAAADSAGRQGDEAERERLDGEAIDARAERGRATFAVFEIIREHLRATAPTPAAAAQAFLEPGTVLLSIGLAGDAGVAVGLSRDAVAAVGTEDATALLARFRAIRDAAAAGGAVPAPAVTEVRAWLTESPLRPLLDAAERLVILPSPDVAGVPFELILDGMPVSYASSASIYFDRIDAAAELVLDGPATLVAAGDPDFSGLLQLVAAADPVAPGEAAAAGIAVLRSTSRDQLRSFGGTLAPLPGTRAEVRTIEAVASAAGVDVRPLLGPEASTPDLRRLIRRSEPRYLHLATHGFPGTTERPYTASLALTSPATPTADDTGFLTLDDLIQDWFGLLDETDLVVLSACDTAVGVARGDSDMALPWGFYFAGAPTVICSLWQVDDSATALLMGRLYENLLGGAVEARTIWGRAYGPGESISKADALDEAKAWLRGLSRDGARAALDAIGLTDQPLPRGLGLGGAADADAAAAADAGPEAPAAHPYAHPRYWAAFTLRGSPR